MLFLRMSFSFRKTEKKNLKKKTCVKGEEKECKKLKNFIYIYTDKK
jgi:hypothetical protein